jgi:hypothetical protein
MGISGSKVRDERPAFDRLLRGVARKQFELVAAWSVCRLGRSLQDLVALVFLHPQGTPELHGRLQGNGGLDNAIGYPLETTIAPSHFIFEGTLDRFPGLKLCAAHGGGYLPS